MEISQKIVDYAIWYYLKYFPSKKALEKKLFEKAKNSRLKAYAPYSKFLVGCSILLENGEIYTGSNQENAAYPSGLCAERSVIFWLGANFPNQKIEKLFVIGGLEENPDLDRIVPPCGSCRQSIVEYEVKQAQNIEIYIASISGEKIIKINSIKDLLPFSFDTSFL